MENRLSQLSDKTEDKGGQVDLSGTRPLWTIKEVASYLRLKPETVRIMARDGKLPAFKVGRVWRFHRQDISAWLPQNNSNE
jgi:excisionase family DNA binding protein